MYSENKDFLVNVFLDATNQQAYGHLFLDLKSNSVDLLRVRGNVFNAFPSVYLARKL